MAASTKSKRRFVALAALGGASLLSLLWYFTLPRERVTAGRQDTTVGNPKIPDTRNELTPTLDLARPTPRTTPSSPIIDEISIEKDEVCEGEENLIRAKAHTTDGSDAFLQYIIGGERGQSVPLKRYLLPDGSPMHQTITVFSRDGVSTTVDLPPYVVKKCRPERTLLIEYRVKANTIDEVDFTARLMQSEVDANAFRPVRYLWNFGDKVTLTTTEPFVTHSYAHREQMQMYSDYLVQIEAQPQLGPSVIGRVSLQFLNLTYQDVRKFGIVLLLAQGAPRFPLFSQRGLVRQKFKIWHYYNQSVEFSALVCCN